MASITELRRRARVTGCVRTIHAPASEALESRLLLATICVDINSPDPAPNGTSWVHAYADLQQALGAAVVGDQIHVADGTYKPTSGTDPALSFQLRNGVAVFGGYAGFGATNPDARDPAAYPSILSGNIGVPGSNSDNSYHVVLGNGTDASSVLDGFTITAGNANGSGIDRIGGGMFNYASSPTLSNCIFSGNSAGRGGGMYNDSSSPTLTNCAFNGNSGTNGGGIENGSFSFVTLTGCTFSGNTAAQFGGGMYNESFASPTLTNCTLSGNSATFSGGAIYSSTSSSPTLANCVLWANTAPAGAQIYPSAGTAAVTYTDIQGGFAGIGNIDTDPLFVRNPSVGLDGKWGTADDDLGDLRLQITSPCVDVGSNAAVPSGVTTDLAGNARFIDIPGAHDPGAIVDMGAYERTFVPVTIAGSGGDDQLYVRLTPGGLTLQVFSGPTSGGSQVASYPSYTSCTFDLGGGNDTLTLDVANGMPSVALSGGDGNDTLIVAGTTAATNFVTRPGQIVVDSTAMGWTSTENVVLDGTANAAVGLNSLVVTAPLGLPSGKHMVLSVNSLSITGAGSLDLADNDLILSYSGPAPVQSVRQWLFNGRVGITPAMVSSQAGTALGFVDNSLLQMPSFGGQALGSPFSQVLVKHTVAGDTNLDGQVTQADFLNVLANMGSNRGQWFLGDLNHDGAVNASDLAEVASHLGSGAASVLLPPGAAVNAVAAAKPRVVSAKSKVVPTAKAKKGRTDAAERFILPSRNCLAIGIRESTIKGATRNR